VKSCTLCLGIIGTDIAERVAIVAEPTAKRWPFTMIETMKEADLIHMVHNYVGNLAFEAKSSPQGDIPRRSRANHDG
jgi:hypothetical protein